MLSEKIPKLSPAIKKKKWRRGREMPTILFAMETNEVRGRGAGVYG
jgi:hypothetical protein